MHANGESAVRCGAWVGDCERRLAAKLGEWAAQKNPAKCRKLYAELRVLDAELEAAKSPTDELSDKAVPTRASEAK